MEVVSSCTYNPLGVHRGVRVVESWTESLVIPYPYYGPTKEYPGGWQPDGALLSYGLETRPGLRGGAAKIRDRPGREPASERKHEPMAQIDIEILQPFATRFLEGTNLTPAERAEVLRIAQGFACKDSASAAGVSPETIRARRKRIYRKLDVPGSAELLAKLLALSLKMLSKGERLEARPVTVSMPIPAPAQIQPVMR